MTISRKEAAKFEGTSGMARPQHDDVSVALADQFQPAKNEGSQEDFAQLSVPGDQRPKLGSAQFDNLTRFTGAPEDETSLAGDHRNLAGKFSVAVMYRNSA